MATNSNPKGEGVSQQTPIGQSQPSSNAWLNIDSRIERGTVGSRPDMGADKYGGDMDSGVLFKGNSADSDSYNRELNAGKNEKASNNTGQYGNDPKIERGTVAAREMMPKYGSGKNSPTQEMVGNLIGLGAGATPDTKPEDQYKRDLPTQPGQNVILGTDEAKVRNMPKAEKGIGKPGKGGSRM